MLRMLWLRQRVPDARVGTAMVSFGERAVVMSATISVPGGGQGSGHVAIALDGETGVAQAIEIAETRAIGRALDVLGYVVTESASAAPQDRSTPPAPRPSPDEQAARRTEPPGHVQALRQMKHRDSPPEELATQQPTPVGPYPEEQEAATESPESRAEPAQEAPTPRAGRTETSTSEPDEPELEDISWTAFWGWARTTCQLSSKGQLEELLGQPVGNKTPGQLRQLLNAHFAEDIDDES